MAEKLIPATGFVVETQEGSVWIAAPGASGFSPSGGEASEREVETFAGVIKVAGPPGAESVSVPVAAFMPTHKFFRLVDTARRAGNSRVFRLRREEEVIVAATSGADTAAIDASTGVVTFAGSGVTSGNRDDAATTLFPGISIKIGGNNYYVRDIDDSSGQATVDPDDVSSAVSAANYSLVVPAMSITFTASIRALSPDVPAGGELNTSLELTASSALPYFAFS